MLLAVIRNAIGYQRCTTVGTAASHTITIFRIAVAHCKTSAVHIYMLCGAVSLVGLYIRGERERHSDHWVPYWIDQDKDQTSSFEQSLIAADVVSINTFPRAA